MPQGWPISFVCLGLSCTIGLFVWIVLRDRRRRVEEKRDRALSVLREYEGDSPESAASHVGDDLARQLGVAPAAS